MGDLIPGSCHFVEQEIRRQGQNRRNFFLQISENLMITSLSQFHAYGYGNAGFKVSFFGGIRVGIFLSSFSVFFQDQIHVKKGMIISATYFHPLIKTFFT